MQKEGLLDVWWKKRAGEIMRLWREKARGKENRKQKKETDVFTFGIGRVSNRNVEWREKKGT